MDHFEYQDGALICDGVRADELAGHYGTPLYVYCARTIEHHYQMLFDAFSGADEAPLICYSVKANSNLQILNQLRELGAGFDVVSGGELERVKEIGALPSRVVYAGVGKTAPEIQLAIDAGILLFNVESESELHRIDACARERGTRVGVALRLNPDVDPQTHKYITTGKRENKFGIDLQRADRVLRVAQDLAGIEVQGLHIHLGSQITDTAPFVEGVRRVLDYLKRGGQATAAVRWLDIGGGFGVHYRGEEALPAAAFAQAILPEIKGSGLRLILEPGRFILGNAGILLTRVVTRKDSGKRRFVICDAGMNDLLRPSLYRSFHRIWPVAADSPPPLAVDAEAQGEGPGGNGFTDVVGPICESGDFLGLERSLPEIAEGDLVAVFSAGAYGFSMASNYNTRPRPAEVLVDQGQHRLIRRRETLQDLLQTEMNID